MRETEKMQRISKDYDGSIVDRIVVQRIRLIVGTDE